MKRLLLVVVMLMPGVAYAAPAHADFCTTHPNHWKCKPPPPPPPPPPPAPDCSTDQTQAVLNMIAATPNGGTVQFTAGGCYRIEGTIEFANRQLTLEGNGATFVSTTAPADQRAMWRAVNSTVTWRNMTLTGSYCCGGTLDESLQHAHAIDLRGTTADVDHVTAQDMAGDGVYFGLGYDGVTQSSGTVHDSTLQWIGRNAVSVVAGHDVQILRNRLHLVGFTHVDVEPNSTGPGVQRVTVDSNTISGAWRLAVLAIVPTGRPVSDIAFTNNTLTTPLRVKVNPNLSSARPQNTTITGNTTSATSAAPVIDVQMADTGTVTGNSAPMSGGPFATVNASCGWTVSGNQFPGGSDEALFTNPAC